MEQKSQFLRTELLIGTENQEKLFHSKVSIHGIGGVGSFACEALARAGVGNIILIDNDVIDMTNLNRQIHATHQTIGRSKVEVMKERILTINPKANVMIYQINKENILEEELIDQSLNYVIDAVDTISTKLKLIQRANQIGIPIISAMGAGNKIDPTKFEVADIYATSVCPLCRVMRKELKKRDIQTLKVVYSKEEPIKINREEKQIGSISFVPSVCGLILAGEVIKDITEKPLQDEKNGK